MDAPQAAQTPSPDLYEAHIDAYLASIGNPSRLLRKRMLALCKEAPSRDIRSIDLVVGTSIALARVATWLENSGVDEELYRTATGDNRQYIDVNVAVKVQEVSAYLARAFGGTRAERVRGRIDYWLGRRPRAPLSPSDYEDQLMIQVTIWYQWRALCDVNAYAEFSAPN